MIRIYSIEKFLEESYKRNFQMIRVNSNQIIVIALDPLVLLYVSLKLDFINPFQLFQIYQFSNFLIIL